MSKIVFENLPLEPASFKEIDGITEDRIFSGRSENQRLFASSDRGSVDLGLMVSLAIW